MAKIFADNVMETCTTTGLDDVTLAGVVAGFRAFGAVAVDGDTFDYTIAAVDGSMVRTGQFESGLGKFDSSGQLIRYRVDASSAAGNAKVVFDAGTKIVMLSYNSSSIKGIEDLGNFTLASGSLTPTNAGGFTAYVLSDVDIEITHIVIDMVADVLAVNAIPVIFTYTDATHAGAQLASASSPVADLVAGENALALDTPYHVKAGEIVWLSVFMNITNAPVIAGMGGDAYSMWFAGTATPSDPGGTLLDLTGGPVRVFGRGREVAPVSTALVKIGEQVAASGGYQLGLLTGAFPTTYGSLVIEISGRCDESGMAEMGFGLAFGTPGGAANSDFQAIEATDTTVTASAVVDAAAEATVTLKTPGETAPADVECGYTIEIFDYAGPKNKRYTVSGGLRSGTTAGSMTHISGSGEIRTTEAITACYAWLESSSWVDGSKIVVYGRGG